MKIALLVFLSLSITSCAGRNLAQRQVPDARTNDITTINNSDVFDPLADTTANGGRDTQSYPAPRDNVVTRVGSEKTLDIASWNLREFPLRNSTPSIVADLVTSVGLDLIAVQEVTQVAAFWELVDRLPNHDGVLSEHEFTNVGNQKLGFIYRKDLMIVTDVQLLFTRDHYYFPRPPMQARVILKDSKFDFIVIGVHLKAGIDSESRKRRIQAMKTLQNHVAAIVAAGTEDEVIMLGDFNQGLDEDDSKVMYAPILTAPSDYRIMTQSVSDKGEFSYLTFSKLLDHIIVTSALDDEIGSEIATIPNLDQQISSYRSQVSDHLPVVLRLPVF